MIKKGKDIIVYKKVFGNGKVQIVLDDISKKKYCSSDEIFVDITEIFVKAYGLNIKVKIV